MAEAKRKRRWGDRREGRFLKSVEPYYKFQPFVMKKRNDSSNYFAESVEVTEADRFLRRMREQGYKGMGLLHLFVAAYVRAVSQRPALNRFIAGQRLYARNNIEVIMTVKKSMASDAGETSIKVIFDPRDTIVDVYQKMTEQINAVKEGGDTSTDDVAGTLVKIPRLLLKFAMCLVNILDYFGKLPKVLLNASPFHGSMIITDMGSLGIRPIYHHLYNFGTLPLFLAFGAKRRENELQRDGSVVERKYVDYTVVMDERICDGFYYAQSFKFLKSYLRHPEQLEVPPETVVEDLER